MNCQAYSSFSNVGSDHRVVSCTIRLSLRQSKKPIRNPMKEGDWKYVNATPEVSSAFTLEVRNRFDALAKPDDDVETSYNNLISATQEIALEKLPKKKKQKEKPLSNHALINVARKAVREVAAKHELNPTRSSLRKLTKAQAQLDEAYVNAEAERIEKKLDQIGNLSSSNQHTAAWPTINDLAGRKSKPSIRVKGESAEKRKESWLSYFLNLLGEQPPNTLGNRALPLIQIAKLLDISTSTFTIQELEDAIKSLRGNKAPGLDNIPSLIWKDPLFHDLLLRFCNRTFCSLRPPSAWTKSGIVPIPEKGDLTLPLNYRGISLIPIAAKIFNKLLLNRLVPAVDPLLRNNQNGFRGGRSTISQILALRRIIEGMKRLDKDFTICFVDVRKAFDSINREVMFSILPLYGIPQPIIAAIKALYTHTQASVITPDGETDFFDIEAGVLQGDTLALFLFIVVLDYVLRLSLDTINDKGLQIHPRRSRRQPATHITDLDFADDIALVSDLVTNAEALLHSVEDAASLVGLHCNKTKTEVISSTPNSSFRSLAGNSIKQVDDFKYLGSFVMNSEKDMKSRKALAWVACNKLNKIWHSTLANETKVFIFKTLIEPILLYGAETWTLTTRQQKRLDGAYTNMLRRVQNIHWSEHATLEHICGDIPPLSQKVIKRRLSFAGHCHRATEEMIHHVLLWRPRRHVRYRGLTYPDTIARDACMEKEDLPVAMADRQVWRQVVVSIPAPRAAR